MYWSLADAEYGEKCKQSNKNQHANKQCKMQKHVEWKRTYYYM